MDDLSICKRIAEIEGLEILSEEEWFTDGECLILVNSCSETYNPLTDNALCFQLMVKYNALFTPMVAIKKYSAAIWGKNQIISYGKNENPNKAICLAIIEAHKESNNENNR